WSIYPGTIEYLSNDQLTETIGTTTKHSINLFANYDKQLGYHFFGRRLGFNNELTSVKRFGGTHNNLISKDVNDFDIGTDLMQVIGGANTWALRGYFGRLNYNYKGKYLLEVNGRYDGTSKFPNGQRYDFFPSFSAGWRLSEEPFMESLKSVLNET